MTSHGLSTSLLALVLALGTARPGRAQHATPLPPPSGSSPSPATAPAGASYAHSTVVHAEHGQLDVGRMVLDGPYAGAEAMHFALRFSPGWSWSPDLSGGLRGLSLAEDVPGTEPGVGGERDDPRRGFLRWRVGKDGDSLHFELGLLQTTLGHGSLVNLYQNSPEGAPLAFGVVAEGQLKGGGLTLMLGDALQPTRLLAGRLRLKPLNIILSPDSAIEPNDLNVDPRAAVFGMLIVGFTAVTDLDAPVTAEAVADDGAQVRGRGARPVSAFGLDIETPPVDLGIFHLNPYVDGVMLMGRGDGPGFGLHPGVGVGTDFWGIYWQLSLQYVLGSQGYKPWYYDARYVFERVRTVADGAPKGSRASLAPAAHGYVGALSAQLLDSVSAWVEVSDRIPFDVADGHSYGRARVGATAGPAMANVTVALLREGWRDYDRMFTEDGLSAVVVQGKLSLLFVALIARYTHSVERNIDSGDRFAVDDFSVGTEFGWSL